MSPESLQNAGIREEVGVRGRHERCTRRNRQNGIALKPLGDRSFFTISSRRYAVRHVESTVVYCFFIIRISIQGQTLHRADMIFPGVGRVTHIHRGMPFRFLLFALSVSFGLAILASLKNSADRRLRETRSYVVLHVAWMQLSINYTLVCRT